MPQREQFDPSWQKARIAARIWLKAQHGKVLSPRDKRFARFFGSDPLLENALIHEAGCKVEAEQISRLWTTAQVLPQTFFLQI
jgi:hypothetical protein